MWRLILAARSLWAVVIYLVSTGFFSSQPPASSCPFALALSTASAERWRAELVIRKVVTLRNTNIFYFAECAAWVK